MIEQMTLEIETVAHVAQCFWVKLLFNILRP